MSRRFLVFLAPIVAVSLSVVGATAAQAYWRSAATGKGSATTDTAKVISFSVPAQTFANLYPGKSDDISVSITNPYSRPIAITGVTGSVTTNATGCTGASFSVAANPTGLPTTMTASKTVTATLTNAVTMLPTAAAACQSTSTTTTAVTVAYSVQGTIG